MIALEDVVEVEKNFTQENFKTGINAVFAAALQKILLETALGWLRCSRLADEHTTH